jgi:F0F1-type ATP synthase membrane subunit b/b'
MSESREGDLVTLLREEARLEQMLAGVRRANALRLGEARREADAMLEQLEADLPAVQSAVRESIDAEFAEEIRSIERQTDTECARYDSASDETIRELASFVIDRLFTRSGRTS